MKRIFTIINIFLWVAVVASAQGFFSQGVSQNQKLVEEALADVFKLVHFEYQLEDTTSHERFNLQGKEYFGFAEGLCVKTVSGWIAPASTLTPWKNSLEVKQYPEYKPVFSAASVLSPADTVWKPLDLKVLPESEVLPETSYSRVSEVETFGPGLSICSLDAENEGWIVWVAREGNKLSVTTYSHRVAIADSTTFGIGRKVVPSGIVGGFYVKPSYPSVGVITFGLAGLMEKGSDGWKVIPIEGGKILVQKPTLVPDKPKLVPAGDKKDSDSEAPVEDKKNKRDKKNK